MSDTKNTPEGENTSASDPLPVEWRYFLPARRRGKNHAFVGPDTLSLCGKVDRRQTNAGIPERGRCRTCEMDERTRTRATEAENTPEYAYGVELEPGVWLAEGEGDPARTTARANAMRFATATEARTALAGARAYRPFEFAMVESFAENTPEGESALHGALGIDTPLPVWDVLEILAASETHLRTDHNCDCHGHERRLYASRAATTLAANIRQALANPPPTPAENTPEVLRPGLLEAAEIVEIGHEWGCQPESKCDHQTIADTIRNVADGMSLGAAAMKACGVTERANTPHNPRTAPAANTPEGDGNVRDALEGSDGE